VNDTSSKPSEPAKPSGERRQVTVLFADMVGFTGISERLGEEGTFALIQPIYDLMARTVKELGGSVKDFTGDGIMALFGVPKALEDAPLRACRAALLIHERLAAAAPSIEVKHGVHPQLRIGINSGLAVVTQIRGESDAMTALGDTVNLASRLQTLAEPGTVYVSEATQRLVDGLVETAFAGAHAIKGKAEPQNVYQLNGLRQGATRFEAAVGRGLTAYVGRERELDILERALAEARKQLRVIDIVAEPGMGKSRLLHEFRSRLDKERIFVLSGSCSPDGQQTPFLPFIEVVRASFQVKAGEAEQEIARKLEIGLDVLGLQSGKNLALLLNLLGLKPPEGSLAGLDGVLIGLHTRDLLQNLLEVRCRLSPVILLIEDIHWIDSVSQGLLGKIVEDKGEQRLLVLHTRRPEYEPPWWNNPVVTSLPLEPLAAGDIRRLIQTRLGVEVVPDLVTRQVIEKAEGNALFAEEILSFFIERGALRIQAGKVEFEANAVAVALPASIQSLLTTRVDRLPPQDRVLLQAAAVIGRRFDPHLLAAVAHDVGDVEARLNAMRELDLVHPEGNAGDYSFKHALVRDALFQSLLTERRAALHLKIAEEIERRSGNRLTEVVETLAYHYSQADRSAKAFIYLALAGNKSLGVYSLDEAAGYFDAAIGLLDANSDLAADEQVADLLVDYTLYANLSLKLKSLTTMVERFLPRLATLGDNSKSILIHHHYVLALLWSGRYREAESAQTSLSAAAARLRDTRSTAYALASALHAATFISAQPTEVFEAFSCEAIDAASNVEDAYIQCFIRFVIGWEEFHRGRVTKAHEAADELMTVARRMNDPRAIGLGMRLRSWVALVCDDYENALKFAETGVINALTPDDREGAELAKIAALVLLRQPNALERLEASMTYCRANGWHWHLTGADGIWKVALVLNGDIAKGIKWMEKSILRREKEGYYRAADWYRIWLCEIYLEIISGKEKPSAKILFRNLLTILKVMFTAEKFICTDMGRLQQSPHWDRQGHHYGRTEMILGLFYKFKKKRPLAVQHLTEAQRIISQFGPSPLLTRIETALADVT